MTVNDLGAFVPPDIYQPCTFPVARELALVRLRSSRKSIALGVPDTPRLQVWGPLRDPAGASSLATGHVLDRYLVGLLSFVPEILATISATTALTRAVCRRSAWVTSHTS